MPTSHPMKMAELIILSNRSLCHHASKLFFFCFWLLFFAAVPLTTCQPLDFPTANLSTRWTNDRSLRHRFTFPDGSFIRVILLRGSYGQSFALGFYCTAPCSSFLLALFLVYTDSGSVKTYHASPQVLWSPNRSRPVDAKSTLFFSSDGNLALYDSDSTLVWSTNTSGGSVAGLNLTEVGNLILFDRDNGPVWQSFENPTDTLLIGQTLDVGQRLAANVSITNTSEGQFFLTVSQSGLYAYVDSDPPQTYFQLLSSTKNVEYANGSLVLYSRFGMGILNRWIFLPPATSTQYMRLENDGHLRVYAWDASTGWRPIANVFAGYPDDCAYPTVCGAYGLCSKGLQCSCPPGAGAGVSHFRPVDVRRPNLGCLAETHLSCQRVQDHRLLALDSVSYFNYIDADAAVHGLDDEDSCKRACLANCSCKAAFFRHATNESSSACYLPSQVFSMINNQPEVTKYNSSAYIKVQITPDVVSPSPAAVLPRRKESSNVGLILGPVVGGLLAALLVGIVVYVWRKKKVKELEEGDDQLDQVPGMPTRFSFEELRIATQNFSTKLGEGGFGCVFAGTVADGTKVAVKRLDYVGQGMKEFLAEVQTIGGINHINLVRLIGFCAEKAHRLLVYEYMCNGSLDKWIFHGNMNDSLDWHIRRKIITDIAKGLSYLHEECRQRIAHLDIKPQNILLDDKFNAKLSDFGLCKLIDREESQVMTRMRGTPGYLAPEWLTSMITEMVDVYSFGVVIMEIVCGRKSLDYSQPVECIHLINQVQKMIAIDRLVDLVDSNGVDMRLHRREAAEIMRLALWCLQSDPNRRPSMSTVVKVLEGSLAVEHELDLDFSSPTLLVSHDAKHLTASAPLMESISSRPK